MGENAVVNFAEVSERSLIGMTGSPTCRQDLRRRVSRGFQTEAVQVIAVSSVVNVSTRWPPPVCGTGSLVCAEPDVTMGPEHLRVTDLVAELAQQGLHRPANLFVVDLLARLPVGQRVVDLQALVEIKNRIGPAVEMRCWSFHLRWAPGNRSRKSRLWHRRRMNRRVRLADSSLSYRLAQELAVVRSGA